MKRLGNVYSEIINIENLYLAHKNACKGKSKQRGVIAFKNNLDANIASLHTELLTGSYTVPEYKTFVIYEPKRREIFVLPYRDRIVQHAILKKVGDMFVRNFTKNTYSCIKGRGIHKGKRDVEKGVRTEKFEYALKIDITQFYPSVDHQVLKAMLLRKIKDKKLISLLFDIIDSASGLPIGSYLSQVLGNFYLSPLDHWLKEEMKAEFCARYCDDILVLSNSKQFLHKLRVSIRDYLSERLKLDMKGNWQVFPVADRGIDFLGYKMYPTHTLLRKSIKKTFARKLAKGASEQAIASYCGWLKWCNSTNLKNKLLNNGN